MELLTEEVESVSYIRWDDKQKRTYWVTVNYNNQNGTYTWNTAYGNYIDKILTKVDNLTLEEINKRISRLKKEYEISFYSVKKEYLDVDEE